MPTFIKTGYWESAVKNYKGWLNLENVIFNVIPSQEGNGGKYLTTDGSALSWASVVAPNIYTDNGTLTGNRVVTLNDKQLVFRSNQSTLQNYTFTVGTPTGLTPSTWPASVIFEGEYLLNSNNSEPFNTRSWARNQSSSNRNFWVNQVIADITSESTGKTTIYNQYFRTGRGSLLDTSTAQTILMRGTWNVLGHIYTSGQATTTTIDTYVQDVYLAESRNYTGNISFLYSYNIQNSVGYNGTPFTTNVTNYYGLYQNTNVNDPKSTITNHYGIFLNTPTGTGNIINRWGFYAPDAATNHHLNGKLLIGTTTSGISNVRISGLPTSSAGLVSGELWNDAGTVKIIP